MDDNLNSLLKAYLKKDKVEGAFYIDGSWGSGKTFFIKNFIEKYNKEHKNQTEKIDPCLYISISGMKTIDEINSELFSLCHPKMSKIANSKVGKTLFVALKALGSSKGIDSQTIEDVTKNIGSFFKNTSHILVLDDFERCRIDLQELFAYITSLIIDSGIKVVLIGNDIEVRRYLQEEALYKEKSIAATMSKDFAEYQQNLDKIKGPLLYDSIKEKCIYQSYNYVFDTSILFEKIVLDYPKYIAKMVCGQRVLIKRILKQYGCCNLRTCKSALDLFHSLLLKLRKRFNNDLLVKKELLVTTFTYSVLFKNGMPMTNFHELFLDIGMRIYPMNSVGKYVYFGAFDKTNILKELEFVDNELSTLKSSETPDSIKRINDTWYSKTDDEIKTDIHNLLNDIDSLPFSFYLRALSAFLTYKDWYREDDTINIDNILSHMIDLIDQAKGEIDYNEDYLLFEHPEYSLHFLRKLSSAFDTHNSNVYANNLSVSKTSLENYTPDELRKIESNAFGNRCFFSKIDLKELMSTIDNGEASTIMMVRRFLRNVYNVSNIGSFFKADLDQMLLFKTELEQYTSSSVVKNRALELLKKDVCEYIAKLKQY